MYSNVRVYIFTCVTQFYICTKLCRFICLPLTLSFEGIKPSHEAGILHGQETVLSDTLELQDSKTLRRIAKGHRQLRLWKKNMLL